MMMMKVYGMRWKAHCWKNVVQSEKELINFFISFHHSNILARKERNNCETKRNRLLLTRERRKKT